MNKNKNLGFTLAEVLIVIGIIGVVAALTLPNLNHATGDKETVTRVKKAYSTLSDAFDRAQVVYGNFDTWFKGLETESNVNKRFEVFAKRVTEFMKISKDCGISNDSDTDCYVYSPIIGNGGYTVSLPDGMLVGFAGVSEDKIKAIITAVIGLVILIASIIPAFVIKKDTKKVEKKL